MALDAAAEMVRTIGWANLRMYDVAARIGVSKPTLYKYFGSKDQLANAYLNREVDQLLEVATTAVNRYPNDPERALSEGLRTVIETLSANPAVATVLADAETAAALLPMVTVDGRRLLARAADGFAPVIEAAVPGLPEADVRAYADTMVRVIVSHVIQPASSVEESVDLILRVAIPVLRSLQAAPGTAHSPSRGQHQ